MKSKFKDLLLYSLATIGVVALFISATQKISYTQNSAPQTYSTPESHVWEATNPDANTNIYLYNKVTGEVWYVRGGLGMHLVEKILD